MSRPISIEEMVKKFKKRHKTSHMFKIDNFSLFKKHGIESVESSVFDLAGHKWKLEVYPYGNKTEDEEEEEEDDEEDEEDDEEDEEDDEEDEEEEEEEEEEDKGHAVSIYLWNQSSVDDKPEYELFVISQLKRKDWHTHGIDTFDTYSESNREGYRDFISLADLERKGYLIGDCCMFGVKFHGIEPAKSGTAECISLIEKPLNHKVTWMMSKFSFFDPRNVHQSNEFVVGNRKWRIIVHPRGCMGEENKSFSVYLSAKGFINNAPKAYTYARFKLQVLDQVSSRNHVEKTDSAWLDAESDDNNGFADFMPLRKLREPYLVEDKLYVGVDFEVISIRNYL